MTSTGFCFQEVQTLLDTPRLALGKAVARFTALLVKTDGEARRSLGKDAGPARGARTILLICFPSHFALAPQGLSHGENLL